jgi:hypothetical protein
MRDGARPRDLEDRTFLFAESVRTFTYFFVNHLKVEPFMMPSFLNLLRLKFCLVLGNWDLELLILEAREGTK